MPFAGLATWVFGLELEANTNPRYTLDAGDAGDAGAVGRNAAAERAIGDKVDPELTAGVEGADHDFPPLWRVFDRHRRDRMGGVVAPDRQRAHFRNTQKTHLVFAHQRTHRADRCYRIDPVDVVEIDKFDAQ